MDDNKNTSTVAETEEVTNSVAEAVAESTNTETDTEISGSQNDNVSQNDVGLIKCVSDLLNQYRNLPENLTIYHYNIYGDNYGDNAVNQGAGHDNIFEEDVAIGVSSEAKEAKNETHIRDHESITWNLSNYSKVYEYLKKNRNDPYCSFIISLSIFDGSRYNLVYDEAKILYEMLVDETYITTKESEKVVVHRDAFAVSRQEATEMFGIRFYPDIIRARGLPMVADFVRFSSEEHVRNILKCIFLEFMEFRDKITGFLTRLICSEQIVLYAAAINTLKNICNVDFEYFINRIVVHLVKKKSIPADIAVSQILYSMEEKLETLKEPRSSVDRYLKLVQRIMDKDIHYYIITLTMCKTLSYDRSQIRKLIRPIIHKLIFHPRLQALLDSAQTDLSDKDDFLNNIGLFFNIGNRYAEYYIAIVLELYDLLLDNDDYRELVCFIMLLFIKEDYHESRLNTNNPEKFTNMVFIRLILRTKDKDDIGSKLIYLWSEILKNKKFKVTAEKILTECLLQGNSVSISDTEYKKIKFFFVQLAKRDNVPGKTKFFLKRLYTNPKNRIDLAGQIFRDMGGRL